MVGHVMLVFSSTHFGKVTVGAKRYKHLTQRRGEQAKKKTAANESGCR